MGALDKPVTLDRVCVVHDALAAAGPAAAKAVPELRLATRDGSPEVRRRVIQALASAGIRNGEPTGDRIEDLTWMLRHDSSASVRVTAADVLGRLGSRALPGLWGLVAALGDSVPDVRAAAAAALAEIGPPAREALPRLTEVALHDGAPAVCAAATEAQAGIEGHPTRMAPLREPTAIERCMSNPTSAAC